jgi:hypothetical protein
MIERRNDDEYYEVGACYLFSVVNVWIWIECWTDRYYYYYYVIKMGASLRAWCGAFIHVVHTYLLPKLTSLHGISGAVNLKMRLKL